MPSNSNHPFQSDINYLNKNYDATVTPGDDVSIQPNIPGRARIVFISFVFTADANVADRSIEVGIETAGTFIALGGSAHKVTASEVWHYYCYPGAPVDITATQIHRYIPFPNSYLFFDEDYLQTNTHNIQVGDVFSEVSVWLEYQPTPKTI